ncbi:hypothetical protein ASPWEDRAFT_412362 [Aspergillus wentii DTO 134E9]|uniref:Uncharacterized protein n=1 Tax=Aspergillus wentii DTO 134E9 TaxID=1073089 RepID=A0A1L9RNV4_ASPWE|nr:uncharacterized protein ASPWEDRAFT_412362 [Aspergillus wentii DTO 134E9]OJJ36553.1 hypothetical protein ASPWEDRAFT_412362 [Aspergillus wentii DTO 134E9]
MCYFFPNLPPCACILQLYQPCQQARIHHLPDRYPVPIVQVCGKVYFVPGGPYRICPRCHAGFPPGVGTCVALVGVGICIPVLQQQQQQAIMNSDQRVITGGVSSGEGGLRRAKRSQFRRQRLSSPQLRLRNKWLSSLRVVEEDICCWGPGGGFWGFEFFSGCELGQWGGLRCEFIGITKG